MMKKKRERNYYLVNINLSCVYARYVQPHRRPPPPPRHSCRTFTSKLKISITSSNEQSWPRGIQSAHFIPLLVLIFKLIRILYLPPVEDTDDARVWVFDTSRLPSTEDIVHVEIRGESESPIVVKLLKYRNKVSDRKRVTTSPSGSI